MTNSRARAVPARSAIRCVPPISGVMPTTFSTSPNCTPSAAHSRSQASDELQARGQAQAVHDGSAWAAAGPRARG